MRRLTYAATLTLLAAYGWWRSYYRPHDSAGWRHAPHQQDILSFRGILQVAWGTVLTSENAVPDGWYETFTINKSWWRESILGFAFSDSHGKSPGVEWDIHYIRIPWYFLTFLPLLPLAL